MYGLARCFNEANSMSGRHAASKEMAYRRMKSMSKIECIPNESRRCRHAWPNPNDACTPFDVDKVKAPWDGRRLVRERGR